MFWQISANSGTFPAISDYFWLFLGGVFLNVVYFLMTRRQCVRRIHFIVLIFRKSLGLINKGGQKSSFFMNTISLYYFPFQDNLGIIFSKFEVPSISDGSHNGKWILANPFKIAKFQSEKSSVLTPDLSRSWKSTIWKCLSFLEIPSGSASKNAF